MAIGETVTERMVPVACDLIGRVRDGGLQPVRGLLRSLTPRERYALTIVLAAMVPTDRSPQELLDWVDNPEPVTTADDPTITPLRPCGTHAAYSRHKARGEVVDLRCLNAERAYQRARKRTRRAAA